jgi:hypothetical protein
VREWDKLKNGRLRDLRVCKKEMEKERHGLSKPKLTRFDASSVGMEASASG